MDFSIDTPHLPMPFNANRTTLHMIAKWFWTAWSINSTSSILQSGLAGALLDWICSGNSYEIPNQKSIWRDPDLEEIRIISISNQKCVSFEIMTTLFPNQKFWFQKLKFQIRNSDSDSKNKQMIPDLKLWFQTKNSDAKWKEMFLEFYLGIRNANANMSLSHNICSNLQGGIKNSNIQTFEHTFCKTASWNQNFWFPSERISDSISRNLLAPS